IDDDELFFLKTMQRSLVALRSLKDGGSWANAHQQLDKIFLALNRMTRSPQRFHYFFSSLAIPNFLKALETEARMETERQLVVTAIALKRFQLAHGAFPRTLESLVKSYLPSLPHDLMSGEVLCYHLDAGGRPVLYSVGMDGEDNGGDPTPAQGSRYGLWEGRD